MSFLPVAGGNFLGGYISGSVYQKLADKTTLLLRYLHQNHITVPQGLKGKELVEFATSKLHLTTNQLNDILWNTYHPSQIWHVFTSIGLVTVLGLILYDLLIVRKK